MKWRDFAILFLGIKKLTANREEADQPLRRRKDENY
jgi:hypothetical protein